MEGLNEVVGVGVTVVEALSVCKHPSCLLLWCKVLLVKIVCDKPKVLPLGPKLLNQGCCLDQVTFLSDLFELFGQVYK